jgi:asparagine N-glycosylation enzyme membrane subunit Stt3
MTALTNRYVTLQKESAYGQSQRQAPQSNSWVKWMMSHSPKTSIYYSQDISRYGASKSVQGLTYSEGDVNLPLQLDNFNSFCLFSAFGVDTFAGGASPKTHTFD